MIRFTIPGNPTALKRHRSVRRGNKQWQIDPSANDKADFLALAIQNKPDTPLDEPIFVKTAFYFSRPKSHFRSGKFAGQLKPNAPEWHINKPDFDNLAKFVADSLNGIFWRDDSIICESLISKRYDSHPRIVVEIIPLT